MILILIYQTLIWAVLSNVSIIPMKRCFKQSCLQDNDEMEEFNSCFKKAELQELKKSKEQQQEELLYTEPDIYDYYDYFYASLKECKIENFEERTEKCLVFECSPSIERDLIIQKKRREEYREKECEKIGEKCLNDADYFNKKK